uniref:NADH-ubiquinone oxidoreductase chain 2 n=1 Tax=Phyllomimus sp. YH-2018 TaxID=2100095 RepID=A0A343UWB0_9ORTH|nr:NADH dehydrogenase subunit 2 [Phyllomimus sp. YH-2018]
MPLNPSNCLFITTLIMGTLISVSSNSWLGVWSGLEINLLSFIPLIAHSKNSLSTEASLKYFLIQALASSILLFSCILMQLTTTMNLLNYQEWFILILISALLLKMGAAPFHFWFPGTMEGLSWLNNLILMTWQKIAPLMLLSYLIKFNLFTLLIILLSIITGSLGGLNQTSLRKMMAYSSINHLGWMISGMMVGENMWLIYFLMYTLLSGSVVLIFHSFQISYLSQNYLILTLHPTLKFFLYSLLLSLGGLPPFIGFVPKWLIIQTLINVNQIPLVTMMAITTLLTLFYYIRLTFSAFLLNPSHLKWNTMNYYYKIPMMIISMLTIFSLSSLLLLFMLWHMH